MKARQKIIVYANWSRDPHLVPPAGWIGGKHMNFGQDRRPVAPVVTQGVAGRTAMLNWEDKNILPKPGAGATDLREWSRQIRLYGFEGDIAYGIDTGIDWGGEHRWDHPVGTIAHALRFTRGFLRASYDTYPDPFIGRREGVRHWKMLSDYRVDRLKMVQEITDQRSVQVVSCQEQATKDCYTKPTLFSDALLEQIATNVDKDLDVCIFAGAANADARAIVDAGILKLAEMIG